MTEQEKAIQETEANYFAMCILIPEEWLRRDLAEMFPNGIDLMQDDVDKLAKRYQVSVQLMTFRLTDIGMTW